MKIWKQIISLTVLVLVKNFTYIKCGEENVYSNETHDSTFNEERFVINLTETKYNEEVLNANNDIVWFIKYFAPWCGHCRNLNPEIIKVAEFFKDNDKIKIARIDCTKESKLCKKNKINGYPTMRLYNKGKYIKQYKSPKRFHTDIIRFIERGMQPDVIIVENLKQLSDLSYDLALYPIFIILFNDRNQLNEYVPLLEGISNKNDFEITLSVTYNNTIKEELILSHKSLKHSEAKECLNHPCMLVLGKENFSPIVRLNKNIDYVLSYIQQYRFPFFGIPSKLDFIDYLNSGNLIVIIGINEQVQSPSNKTEIVDQLYNVSKKVRNDLFLPVKFEEKDTPRGIIFAIIDFNSYSSLFREYGITHFNFMKGYEIVIADGLKYYYNNQEYMRTDILYETIELVIKQDKKIPKLKAYSIFSMNSIRRFLYELNTAVSTIFYKSWYHAIAITAVAILFVAGITIFLCLLLFGDTVESYLLDDLIEMDKSEVAPSHSKSSIDSVINETDDNSESRKER
ncbi:thioredoxin disulfide isomerase A6 transmembrane domain in C-terminal region [Cryptosporidium xiaoi]|uniref:Thioredoxin disulfide isomerase A6 transmembrane domain in C-terminal region n=1 Tax=Cryptosporidium xiaoi TaxID=659607 RepID=A0AAV9Y199_9CRYT